MFFPICVLMAWIADRRLLFYKYLHRRYRADKRHGIIVETEGDLAPNGIDIIMEGKLHGNANGGPSSSASNVNSMETSKDPEQEREKVQKKCVGGIQRQLKKYRDSNSTNPCKAAKALLKQSQTFANNKLLIIA